MECMMDLLRFWEAQLIGDGGEDLDNCEGSFMFQGEFGIGNGAFEISGFQPDFVSFGKGSKSLVVM